MVADQDFIVHRKAVIIIARAEKAIVAEECGAVEQLRRNLRPGRVAPKETVPASEAARQTDIRITVRIGKEDQGIVLILACIGAG